MSTEDDFNYWHEDHYEIKVVSGSEASCMKVFKADQEKYPTRQYATHICFKTFEEQGVQCKIIIKRFKTPELCKKHTATAPGLPAFNCEI